jgi:hypothetical protein
VLWSHPTPKVPDIARAVVDTLRKALPFRVLPRGGAEVHRVRDGV